VTPETRNLPNGLRLAAAESAGSGSFVDLAIAVRAGRRYEGPYQCGMSHLVEHSLGRGSINYPSSYFLHHALELLGDGLDSETYAEHTAYWLRVPPEGLERALAILADLFAEPVFKDVEAVKEVVFDEIDAEAGGAWETAWAELFGGHPLGRPRWGTRDALRSASRADVLEHFRELYQPDNMAIAAAGAIEPEKFFGAAEAAFGGLEPFGPAEAAPGRETAGADDYEYAAIEPADPSKLPEGGTKIRYLAGGDDVEVALAFACGGEKGKDRTALDALARALGDGGASRLRRAFIERLGIARAPSARLVAHTDVGVLEVGFRVAPAQARLAIQEAFRALRAARAAELPVEEMERLRARMEREAVALFEDPRALSRRLAEAALLGIPMSRKLRDHRHAAIQLTAAAVREAAEKTLVPERMAAVIRGPLPEIDRGDIAQILAVGLTKGF
jgi:predicted Zn-dependent peptidase